MKKHKVRKAIESWNCVGKFGYGQGRAVAEFGQEEVGNESVCHNICPNSAKCRGLHTIRMDERFPEVADIVKKTAVMAKRTDLPVVETVISAMNVAVKRNSPEALRIQEGLKKYGVRSMTDHYIYGQFENLANGLDKKAPDTQPLFVLPSAKFGGKLV